MEKLLSLQMLSDLDYESNVDSPMSTLSMECSTESGVCSTASIGCTAPTTQTFNW